MRSAIYDPIFSSIPLPLLSSVAHCSLLLLLFLSLLTYLLTPSLQTPPLSLSLSLSLSLLTLAAAFSDFLPRPACWFVVVFVVVVGGGGGTPLPGPTQYNKQTNKQTTSSNSFPSSSFRLPSHSVF
jgi:hypothetical protein